MRFKKQLSLFLAFFLLISHSGLAFNVHYCGEKIAAVSSVFNKEEPCKTILKGENECCIKQNKSHKKCCSDKEINLEIDTDSILFKSFSVDFDFCYFPTEWYPTHCNTIISESKTQNITYCFDANTLPLYKIYSQYILYS